MANICVFCSSSKDIDPIYLETAAEMGRLIGENKHNLVYGGINLGCMAEVARVASIHDAKVMGIVPFVFQDHPKRMDGAFFVKDLHRRKSVMETLSDAFVVLSGGFGTLDELMGVMATKLVGEHDKPIVLVNIDNFYRPILAQFDHTYKNNFAREENRQLFHLSGTPIGAMDYINQHLST